MAQHRRAAVLPEVEETATPLGIKTKIPGTEYRRYLA
jgi:hypothetical protein